MSNLLEEGKEKKQHVTKHNQSSSPCFFPHPSVRICRLEGGESTRDSGNLEIWAMKSCGNPGCREEDLLLSHTLILKGLSYFRTTGWALQGETLPSFWTASHPFPAQGLPPTWHCVERRGKSSANPHSEGFLAYCLTAGKLLRLHLVQKHLPW